MTQTEACRTAFCYRVRRGIAEITGNQAGFGGMEAARRLDPGLAEIVPVNCTTTSWLVDPAERDAEGADPAALSKSHQAARASLG